METKESKAIISRISFELSRQNRAEMVKLIKELSEEEFENLNNLWKLAEETNEQISARLNDILSYYLQCIY